MARKCIWHRELADTALRIVGLWGRPARRMLVVDHGQRHLPARADAQEQADRAVSRALLSETGLFAATAEHRAAPGVIPYSVNVRRLERRRDGRAIHGTARRRQDRLPLRPQLGFSRRRGPGADARRSSGSQAIRRRGFASKPACCCDSKANGPATRIAGMPTDRRGAGRWRRGRSEIGDATAPAARDEPGRGAFPAATSAWPATAGPPVRARGSRRPQLNRVHDTAACRQSVAGARSHRFVQASRLAKPPAG